jgi:hypothetical protein
VTGKWVDKSQIGLKFLMFKVKCVWNPLFIPSSGGYPLHASRGLINTDDYVNQIEQKRHSGSHMTSGLIQARH